MKKCNKIFALVLAALTALSCMTVVSFADEAQGPAPIQITDATTIEGWSHTDSSSNPFVSPAIDEELGTVAATYTGTLRANGGWVSNSDNGYGLKIGYQVSNDTNYEATSFDVTGMTHIAFDLYISNAAAVEGKEFDFELCSGGRDKEERTWRMSLEALKGGALKDGWNHFEVDLTSNNKTQGGEFRYTSWNYLRLYNKSAIDAGEGLTIGFRNIYFFARAKTGDESKLPEDGIVTAGTTIEGWSHTDAPSNPFVSPAIDAKLGTVAATYTGAIRANGGWVSKSDNGYGLKIGYKVSDDTNYPKKSFDISEMKYIVFDLYVSDAALIDGIEFDFEISSAGKSDNEELYWRMTLAALKGSSLTDGWNHFEVDLSTYTKTQGATPFDSTAWDFLRLYNRGEFDAGDGFTIAFKNIGFAAISEAAQAGAAAVQAIVELFTPLANINKGDVNAENYEMINAQMKAATEAYDAADMSVQALVDETEISEVKVSKIKRNVTNALEAYEKSLNAPEEPDAPTTDTPEEPTGGDDATTGGDDVTMGGDDTTTGGDDTTTGDDKTEPAEDGSDMTLYLIIGGVALLVVIVVVVIVVKKKK